MTTINTNIIPRMTANDAPAPFVASASSELSADYKAYKAFNGTIATSSDRWLTEAGSTGFLKVDLGIAYVAKKYFIRAWSDYDDRTPKDFTFKGSNNDSDWDTLDTQTGQIFATSETKEYSCSGNSTAYRYYKLDVTDNDGGTYVQVGGMQIEVEITRNWSPPTNLPQSDHIVSFWKLDEESGIRYDETDLNNDLADLTTTGFDTGKINNAADFNSDRLENVTLRGLDITGEITILCWIKPGTVISDHFIANRWWVYSGHAQRAYLLRVNSSKLEAYLSPDGINSTHATSDDNILVDTLQHVGFTLNQVAEEIQMYISGLANGSAVSYSTDINIGYAPFTLGSMSGYSGNYFVDLIDEMIIWKICLTPQEVSDVSDITAYEYGVGIDAGILNWFFVKEALDKGKKYFKKKGLYLPDNKIYKPEILVPEGI